MEKPFIHLHNHSEYSLLDGSATVEALAATAKSYGMPALALTDHGNLFGALYFEKACRAAGVKPIIGCEVYVAPAGRFERQPNSKPFHMCLFCKNEVGYRNLLKLTSAAFTEGFYYKPRVDVELLELYHEGLIASGACLGGEISQLLLNDRYEEAKARALFYDNLFGHGDFYLEIQHHGYPEEEKVRKAMAKLAKDTGLPLIATNDIHYVRKEDEGDNDIFICIGTQKKKSDADRMHASPNCYFRSPEEMYELFADTPEALTNTVALAEKCDLVISKPGPLLPDYGIPADFENEEAYIRKLVYDGLTTRYGERAGAEEVTKRTEFELKTISDMGFNGYFLIVWDFIDWARKNGISVGPGRGSGAGSVVAYALRITDIDPLKYNLLFERFLNPERVSMPDFDVDFSDERRDEVVEYVTNKYGKENVAGIVTFGTLATKAALKDVARVLDIGYDESLLITKAVDADAKNVEDALAKSEALRAFRDRGGVYQELFEVAARLEGLTRQTGMHACGKVIGKSAVVNYVPLTVDTKTKMINTAFESKVIEDCGLVKMDFLGLSTLSLIDHTVEMIKQENPSFDIDAIPEDDELTFKLFCDGATQAIFQFESDGMRKVLKEAHPGCIEDLIALNALYRPGPMQFIPDFVKGKKNPKSIKYFHPDLEAILKPTYGVIVYQEQVMQVAQIFAGYTPGGADLLRRAMSKKKVEEMAEQQKIFVEGALAKGRSAKEAEDLFHILEPFAGYGFNKSHAAAYSVLAYKTAYLKARYPAQFMAANLTAEINNPSSFKHYIDEAHSMGLAIMKPDVDESERDFAVKEGKIYYGLLGVRGLGEAAVAEILAARKGGALFKNFMDFLERIPLESINKRALEALVSAGVFDEVEREHSRGELSANLERAIEWAAQKKREEAKGAGLFGFDDDAAFPPFKYDPAPDLDPEKKLELEKEYLGFYVSGHPLDKYRGAWERYHTLDLSKLDSASSDRPHTVVGLLKEPVFRVTKRGSRMATATLEDFNGAVEVVVFDRALPAVEALFRAGEAIQLTGKIDGSRGSVVFRVDTAALPDDTLKAKDPVDSKSSEIHLFLIGALLSERELLPIKEVLADYPGSMTVYFHLFDPRKNETIVRAGTAFQAGFNPELVEKLSSFPVINRVECA